LVFYDFEHGSAAKSFQGLGVRRLLAELRHHQSAAHIPVDLAWKRAQFLI